MWITEKILEFKLDESAIHFLRFIDKSKNKKNVTDILFH